jgi:hypothetical protein
MEYCRSLKFDEDPNYAHIISMFENGMVKNNFDPKITDFTWKQNRLNKDKEMLKAQMLGVISKRPQKKKKEDTEQTGDSKAEKVPY